MTIDAGPQPSASWSMVTRHRCSSRRSRLSNASSARFVGCRRLSGNESHCRIVSTPSSSILLIRSHLNSPAWRTTTPRGSAATIITRRGRPRWIDETRPSGLVDSARRSAEAAHPRTLSSPSSRVMISDAREIALARTTALCPLIPGHESTASWPHPAGSTRT